ncbi:FG-GAP-like repeat-containing protein [Paraglaciecola sp. 25GB23A]|uniref:FG-GAP repeat domain-containing protein n=1 Tax=Paraglaciecola sp. 25GB23A TaxID=3156068 RepID=UPI0032AFBF43
MLLLRHMQSALIVGFILLLFAPDDVMASRLVMSGTTFLNISEQDSFTTPDGTKYSSREAFWLTRDLDVQANDTVVYDFTSHIYSVYQNITPFTLLTQHEDFADITAAIDLAVYSKDSMLFHVDIGNSEINAPDAMTFVGEFLYGAFIDAGSTLDNDADGLINKDELAKGTDLNNPDSDGDHLLDGDEVNIYYTDPLLTDTDGDGLSDFDEVVTHGTNPTLVDTDGDGMLDKYEVENQLNGLIDDAQLDKDGDGLTNIEEFNIGTKANSNDTDNDGIADADDAYPLVAIGDLLDTDNDGAPNECDAACTFLGMAADTDDDNDGVLDVNDAYPLDATKSQENTNRVRNDLNNDGKSDLLWRSYDKGWNFLWAMNGTATSLTAPINVVADASWDMVGQGDYDGDSKSDILWRNNITGQNFIYLMDGKNIKVRATLNYVTAPIWEVKGSGDFNGDGKGDVLWRRVDRGDTWFYLMNGLKIGTSLPSLWVTDLNFEIAATGDINGDGTDDVIWRNKLTGINYIWIMQDGQIGSRYTLNAINKDWIIAGTGDLDGDGTDDIILRNQVDGRNWAYLMENGTVKVSQLINTVGDTNWQIANIGDYDGDGKADFLWRNEATSQNIVHLMDGLSIKARGVLKPVGSGWKVAK